MATEEFSVDDGMTPDPDDVAVAGPDGQAASPDASVVDTHELLSARIKELRQARGYSIATLARKAGITGAMVSQVERGVTNPSVATVVRIAAVLGVAMSELFEVGYPKGMVVRPGDRRRLVYPNADIVEEYISSDPTNQLLVLESRVGPGARTGQQMAPHGAAVEFVLVVSGTIELSVGDETYVLSDRDTMTFDGRLPHGFANDTDADVRLIWVTTPATF